MKQRVSNTSTREEGFPVPPLPSLEKDGDFHEKAVWGDLQAYISKYEVLWRMHVYPLRIPGSIYIRDGVDEFQAFAMNQYSAFINLASAWQRIEGNWEDLKFAEEVWANLQRAVELVEKAAAAFAKIYMVCAKRKAKINTTRLNHLKDALGEYRNLLHEPLPGTVKDQNGTRMIPRRDKLLKHKRWTDVMYHRDDSDFVPVAVQLRQDFEHVCSVVQGLWGEIQRASGELTNNREYLTRRNAGRAPIAPGSVNNPLAASATSNSLTFGVGGLTERK